MKKAEEVRAALVVDALVSVPLLGSVGRVELQWGQVVQLRNTPGCVLDVVVLWLVRDNEPGRRGAADLVAAPAEGQTAATLSAWEIVHIVEAPQESPSSLPGVERAALWLLGHRGLALLRDEALCAVLQEALGGQCRKSDFCRAVEKVLSEARGDELDDLRAALLEHLTTAFH
eukprot:TRINITY_DN1425_c0_g1_i1.p4 TRINITY_DN1425_c0_g1~~TRINITY_DN1425_c0_g1_i1.p4  ORF type:complete len:173 (+),score=47.94 TRINITY_DN1425_c0_g1_i1:561-1079(+)